jgi:hypothetical protein
METNNSSNNEIPDKLANYVKTNSKKHCNCPVYKSNSGYFKKHSCVEGKRKRRIKN